jgi:hypothetical protein
VRLASLLCLLPVMASGCFLGADPLPANVHDDAGPDSPPPPPDAPPPPMCKNAQNTVDTGHHNAGLNCMSSSCHGNAGGLDAPPFTLGGTLYADALATKPVKYAIVSIVDADGAKLDLVTALNGNFYTSQALKYPIRVYASSCPTIQTMTSSVQYGACNQCHAAAGGTTTPITLPPQ